MIIQKRSQMSGIVVTTYSAAIFLITKLKELKGILMLVVLVLQPKSFLVGCSIS